MLACLLVMSLMSELPIDGRLVEEERDRVEVIARISPAVTAVFMHGGGGGGSGVVISSDGYALTNFHVTGDQSPALKCGLPDGRLYDAVVVGLDPGGDVALIKLLGRDDFPHAPLGDSDTLKLGDPVLAIGNPFLLATDFAPTVTSGIVSGLHRYQEPAGNGALEYTDCIQTDAAINPGNSGGPLFNARGEVVGINGRISLEKRGRVNVGVGYAISINQIKHFMEHLKGGLIVPHGTLNATVHSSDDGRVLIDSVLESSEAFRRGIRPGDELVRFASRPIGSANEFQNVLGIYPAGWRVPLTVRRDQQQVEYEIKLSSLSVQKPKEEGRPGPPRGLMPPGVPPLPAAIKEVYEKKAGFANYHFNRKARDGILSALAGQGDFKSKDGTWEITFEGNGGTTIVAKLGAEVASWTVGEETRVFKRDETDPLEPPESGGLLPALLAWRSFLVQGSKGFDRCDYAGAYPFGFASPSPALTTDRSGMASQWYFDPSTSRLAGWELFATAGADPCEVRVADYGDVSGLPMPRQWEVWHGGKPFGQYSLKSVEWK